MVEGVDWGTKVIHRDRLLSALALAPGGLTTTALADRVETPAGACNVAAVEATLMLSPEVSREGDRWKLIVRARAARLLAAIESYADSSGKRNLSVGRSPIERSYGRPSNGRRAA